MKQPSIIVFVHGGDSWYLRYTTNQARSISAGSPVVLLGDIQIGDGIITSPLERHKSSDMARRFREAYVHTHSGNREWELFCFLRWFCLLDYMEENRTESALYLDSDVLLYSSIEEIANAYNAPQLQCGLSIPRQSFESYHWHVSGHASYWTRESLKQFCDFATRSFSEEKYLAMYREKWAWNQRTGKPGGVSDMTALYLFWLESKDSIVNFAEVSNGTVFDHNMNIPLNGEEDEYVMAGARKHIDFVDDKPVLTRRTTGDKIRAHELHLQGGAKNFIPLYYRGGPFTGKTAGDSYAFLRRLGQRGKRLVGR